MIGVPTPKGLRRVVYTVVTDGFDEILPPVHEEAELDYVAFSDAESPLPAPWQYRPLASRQRNPRMTARWHKLHPHLLFPDHDQDLYVDANILITGQLGGLYDEALRDAPLAMFRHPSRNCTYEEAEVVKRVRYDDAAIVDAQMAFYRARGLPRQSGLYQGSVQFRRHRDPKLIGLLEDWWHQLKLFSHRDQLSLSFMLRRHGLPVSILPGNIRDNPWFITGPHQRFRVDLATMPPPDDADEIDRLRAAFIVASRRSSGIDLDEAWRSIVRYAKAPPGAIKLRLRQWLWQLTLARHYRSRRGAE